jgi:hypothetical protein
LAQGLLKMRQSLKVDRDSVMVFLAVAGASSPSNAQGGPPGL